ncbi:MAG: hypothetical protein KatS3mg129_2157 [Leptospiraceae bacterium]|nr:MAG: hypothetical protein KatS3mg129_2157 [Leptospiraceae bacterium]
MKSIKLLLFTLFLLPIINCFALIGNPNGYGPTGLIFTKTKIGVSGTEIKDNMIRSEACTGTYILILTTGEGTIEEAARKKNIRKIYLVENEMFGILGPLFSQMCTVVYGSNEITNSQFIPEYKNATIVLKTGQKLENVQYQKLDDFYKIKTQSGDFFEIASNQILNIEI